MSGISENVAAVKLEIENEEKEKNFWKDGIKELKSKRENCSLCGLNSPLSTLNSITPFFPLPI